MFYRAMLMAERSERLYESEAWRIRGDGEAAEAAFTRAMAAARCGDIKLFELRAAASLARLWQSQSKTPEASELLAPVYGWFTEGFDTPDMIEAKALLDKLR